MSRELTLYMQSLKSHAVSRGIKVTNAGANRRHGYHIRFPLKGGITDFRKFFKTLNVKVEYSDTSLSAQYETFSLYKDGIEIKWVNNINTIGGKSDRLFGPKDLTPDELGLAGKTLSSQQIINQISKTIYEKYDEEISSILIEILKKSKSKNSIIYTNSSFFNTKDLATISKNFGEILSSVWCLNNLDFKKCFFPVASNEKLVDIYGINNNFKYPISVKSGGGGKVTVQNILDSLDDKQKTTKLKKEIALEVFNIIKDNDARRGIFEVNKYLNTPGYKKIKSIVRKTNLTYDDLVKWLDSKSISELKKKLKPFHKALNTSITEPIWERGDKVRFVISPLGEKLHPYLNKDVKFKKSLTNLAQKLSLLQVNVDINKSQIKFQHNYFKEAKFEFGWAGYAAGNKLGFKMKV